MCLFQKATKIHLSSNINMCNGWKWYCTARVGKHHSNYHNVTVFAIFHKTTLEWGQLMVCMMVVCMMVVCMMVVCMIEESCRYWHMMMAVCILVVILVCMLVVNMMVNCNDIKCSCSLWRGILTPTRTCTYACVYVCMYVRICVCMYHRVACISATLDKKHVVILFLLTIFLLYMHSNPAQYDDPNSNHCLARMKQLPPPSDVALHSGRHMGPPVSY